MKPYCGFCRKEPNLRQFLEDYLIAEFHDEKLWLGKTLLDKDPETGKQISIPETPFQNNYYYPEHTIYFCSDKCFKDWIDCKDPPYYKKLIGESITLLKQQDKLMGWPEGEYE